MEMDYFDWNDPTDTAKQCHIWVLMFPYKNTRVRNKALNTITNPKLDDNTNSNISEKIVTDTNKELIIHKFCQ